MKQKLVVIFAGIVVSLAVTVMNFHPLVAIWSYAIVVWLAREIFIRNDRGTTRVVRRPKLIPNRSGRGAYGWEYAPDSLRGGHDLPISQYENIAAVNRSAYLMRVRQAP